MTADGFEAYWQQVDAEIVRIYGQAGGDVATNADQIAAMFQRGTSPAGAALDICAERGLNPHQQ